MKAHIAVIEFYRYDENLFYYFTINLLLNYFTIKAPLEKNQIL